MPPPRQPAPPAAPQTHSDVGRRSGGLGLFGPKKSDLAAEVEELRAALARANALSGLELEQEARRAQATLQAARQEYAEVMTSLAAARAQLVETDEIVQLQEAGVYEYAHPLANAVDYKDLLARLKDDRKRLVTGGRAVSASTTWSVNGSQAEGRRMVTDFSKLLLRAYNAEADNCVRTVKPSKRKATMDRLEKAANTIERLGRSMSISITSEYHRARLYEIEITADYLAKVEEEREEARAARERLREEIKAQKEIEREKEKLAKEQAHYLNALERMRSNAASAAEIAQIEAKLGEIGVEMEKVISREANVRTGWVYVISNIGSFGEGVIKIGMTRRMEPLDRVRELGDASVPFRYDVHALIFSNDAVSLETSLHQALADKKVNQVNSAHEFFFATPAQVRELLTEVGGQHLLEYQDDAEAAEWRASGSRRAADFAPRPADAPA